MGLDDSGLTQTALDDIRINGTLDEEVYLANLLGLGLEYANEFLTDDFTLLLRVSYTLQLLIEALTGVNMDEVQVIRAFRSKYRVDFVPLVLAEETVVNEYAGELLADCLGEQDSSNRGINSAGQSAKHLSIADFLPQLGNGLIYEGGHLPVTLAAADTVDEAL